MEKITLYTIGCPKCTILEKKLKSKNISFETNSNIEEMKAKHYLSMPILEIDGKPLQFTEAIKWVNQV